MAIKPQCVDALNRAAGRVLRQSELDSIEARLGSAMRKVARSDPKWRSMSAADHVMAAAQLAMQELQAEAARKVANVQRQALGFRRAPAAWTEGMTADMFYAVQPGAELVVRAFYLDSLGGGFDAPASHH